MLVEVRPLLLQSARSRHHEDAVLLQCLPDILEHFLRVSNVLDKLEADSNVELPVRRELLGIGGLELDIRVTIMDPRVPDRFRLEIERVYRFSSELGETL